MEVIHKLNITAEAAFDISDCLSLQLDRRTFKAEVEEYITRMSQAGRVPWWGYFRADYIDEDSGKRLKLFLFKGKRTGLMQNWDLRGVCEADDWTQDAEDDGLIRAWVETRIEDLPDGDDWVVRLRVNEIIKRTGQTEYADVLEEVLNDFECERDKKEAERVAFLQSVFFSFRGRRRTRKANKSH